MVCVSTRSGATHNASVFLQEDPFLIRPEIRRPFVCYKKYTSCSCEIKVFVETHIYLQAACVTPIARITGACVLISLRIQVGDSPQNYLVPQGQQDGVDRSVHTETINNPFLRGTISDSCGMHYFIMYIL